MIKSREITVTFTTPKYESFIFHHIIETITFHAEIPNIDREHLRYCNEVSNIRSLWGIYGTDFQGELIMTGTYPDASIWTVLIGYGTNDQDPDTRKFVCITGTGRNASYEYGSDLRELITNALSAYLFYFNSEE